MNHLMIDLETIDTRPSTVILSAGAIVFNETEVRYDLTYYSVLRFQDQLDGGYHAKRTISEDTLLWWFKQSKAAQDAVFLTGEEERRPLQHAIHGIRQLYRENSCERIWSNGATFDISIIEHALFNDGKMPPWDFRAHRDMRTLKDLVPYDDDFMLGVDRGLEHHALDDALYQAEVVVRGLKHIRSANAYLLGAERQL